MRTAKERKYRPAGTHILLQARIATLRSRAAVAFPREYRNTEIPTSTPKAQTTHNPILHPPRRSIRGVVARENVHPITQASVSIHPPTRDQSPPLASTRLICSSLSIRSVPNDMPPCPGGGVAAEPLRSPPCPPLNRPPVNGCAKNPLAPAGEYKLCAASPVPRFPPRL